MNTIVRDITIVNVWFDSQRIYIETSVGDIKSDLLEKYPRLFNASEEERNGFEISPLGIHWEAIDEDLSLDGFYHARSMENYKSE